MSAKVRIKAAEYVTHNVRRFDVEKPPGFSFEPGQATEVSIDRDGWRDEKRPFTFTALPEWDDLQFTIKIYPDHGGVTDQLGKLEELAARFADGRQDRVDGLTVEFDDWWFNARPSNTEPLLRLNVEARTEEFLREKTADVLDLIREEASS